VVRRDVVFVTGTDEAAPFAGAVSDKNVLTHAFDAEDGSLLWTRIYDGPSGSFEWGRMVETSPDGSRVFVGGIVTEGYWKYGVIAYDAATGDEVWTARHVFPDSGRDGLLEDWPTAMAISPDGSTVGLTGRTIGSGGERHGTVLFDAADGSTRWSRVYEGDGGPSEVPERIDIPPTFPVASVRLKGRAQQGNGLAFDPSGERVYVTGGGRVFPGGPVSTTIAYAAGSGEELWVARYGGLPGSIGASNAIAVSPSGDRIYVTGRTSQAGGRFIGSQHDLPSSIDDVATVAYDRDGNEVWAARFDGANHLDMGEAISAHAGGVVVAGRSLVAEIPLLPFANASLLVLSYDA
ncbi:MAG TPA: PQQ-binding-like beta-propeller repeat protein, partial [Actinomycetota bacterium]|nr:PQQ-binding-like beta-propeller repeat protein [Actinomycetota bacterium]